MEKRRTLKTAVSDPLPDKRKAADRTGGHAKPPGTTLGKAGFAALAAAVAIGFVGGWLARRWLRLF